MSNCEARDREMDTNESALTVRAHFGAGRWVALRSLDEADLTVTMTALPLSPVIGIFEPSPCVSRAP